MSTMELEKFPMQVRETFRGAKGTPLGVVQVADELGFAYLDQDIDFGAVGKNEIFQNIKTIVTTEYFSVPLDREFGMDYSLVDRPMRIAEAVLVQEVAMKIALYEPRAQFREVKFAEDWLNGHLSPSVVVALLTTEELPSMIPPGGAAPAAVGGAPGKTIEEVDLPGFYESLIEMARVPGPPGPVGAKGDAATIEAGETTTGAPGTDAEVTNSGTSSAAIFDFVIPKGDKGDQGTGVNIKGTVPNSGALPTTGNEPGDMWIASDTGHGWTWDGDSWVDAGPIQGPVGPEGPQGPQGVQGAQGTAATATAGTTATGTPGTNASVVNVGTLSAAVFNFAIPRGDVGAQGAQGNTGAQGATGSQGPQGTQGPQGNTGTQGPQGNTGAAGPPNVLSVQSTTTGAPGTSANVAIAGTSPAQTLAFTIPRGDVGAQGTQGIQGVPGEVTGPAASVNGELIAFNGTTGKIIKRPAQASGFAKHILNGAFTTQTQMGAADLHPDVIHAQTAKVTALVDADEFLVWDSSVSALRRVSAPIAKYQPGDTVQTVYRSFALQTSAAIMNLATAPTDTQGVLLGGSGLNITPKYANSVLLVRFDCCATRDFATGDGVIALFLVGISNAVSARNFYSAVINQMHSINLVYSLALTTTAIQTFSIRFGPATTAATVVIGGSTAGTVLGGQVNQILTITEIKQ